MFDPSSVMTSPSQTLSSALDQKTSWVIVHRRIYRLYGRDGQHRSIDANKTRTRLDKSLGDHITELDTCSQSEDTSFNVEERVERLVNGGTSLFLVIICVIYCHSKVFMVQGTRLFNLICSLALRGTSLLLVSFAACVTMERINPKNGSGD